MIQVRRFIDSDFAVYASWFDSPPSSRDEVPQYGFTAHDGDELFAVGFINVADGNKAYCDGFACKGDLESLEEEASFSLLVEELTKFARSLSMQKLIFISDELSLDTALVNSSEHIPHVDVYIKVLS